MDQSNPKTWQAILTPHRSLSKQGFVVLMIIIAAVNFAVGTLFMAIGAWPVAGFAGLDVLLMYWAFKVNFASARQMEIISVTEHELVFDRVSKPGRSSQQRFNRRWVRIELEEDAERELIGRLSLVSGQSRIAVGDFLAPEERKTLAQALRQAVAIPRI
jgi:uncharacterized membrane protein